MQEEHNSVSDPLTGFFVFNREVSDIKIINSVSDPLTGFFVFNETKQIFSAGKKVVSDPLTGFFVFNPRLSNQRSLRAVNQLCGSYIYYTKFLINYNTFLLNSLTNNY